MRSAPAPAATAALPHEPVLTERRPPLLEACDVGLTFPNGRTVLKQVSFHVYPEETFVILGGSGCGKSTLLSVLIGLLPPTTGRVLLNGQDIYRFTPRERREAHARCGVLFQGGALLESLSVLENVCLPLREHYRELRREVVAETGRLKLQMVGLERCADEAPSRLSGGMRKRVALARALALDPALVFADEPTSGLDPVSTGEIDALFVKLTRRIGAAAVVVTHDLASFGRIADRALLLGGERDREAQGRVVFTGTPADFRASADPTVGRFRDAGRVEADPTGVCPPTPTLP